MGRVLQDARGCNLRYAPFVIGLQQGSRACWCARKNSFSGREHSMALSWHHPDQFVSRRVEPWCLTPSWQARAHNEQQVATHGPLSTLMLTFVPSS